MKQRVYLVTGLCFGIGAAFSTALLYVSLILILLDAAAIFVIPLFDKASASSKIYSNNVEALKLIEARIKDLEKRNLSIGGR